MSNKNLVKISYFVKALNKALTGLYRKVGVNSLKN